MTICRIQAGIITDRGFDDNTGAFTIQVAQLRPLR